ncbi:hypothetical protein [Actinomadura sp. DC4]|nr:hypothetical protein [Actinomadura sp. DC4]MDN3356396.1 hypothetical protein [Actinomadura sp. DC4]
MAERTAPDDQDVSFRFGVRIMIAGMRSLIQNPGEPSPPGL